MDAAHGRGLAPIDDASVLLSHTMPISYLMPSCRIAVVPWSMGGNAMVCIILGLSNLLTIITNKGRNGISCTKEGRHRLAMPAFSHLMLSWHLAMVCWTMPSNGIPQCLSTDHRGNIH
jgi:hypothetical protein